MPFKRLLCAVDFSPESVEAFRVAVQVEDGHLVISGERRQEHEERRGEFYRSERSYGSFSRAIPFADLRIDRWLMQLTMQQLAREIRRRRTERRKTVHIEEDVPDLPTDAGVSAMGDEIFEFFQC
jgi:Hsp20/alpha crystallin family protein